MDPLERHLRNFAFEHHGDQPYGKSDLPHTYHLQQTVEIIERYLRLFRGDEFLMVGAAWQHDLLEDTDVTFEQLVEHAGLTHARLVWAVTNVERDHNGEKLCRQHKAYYTYPKIRAGGRNAVALKLADRIANVLHSYNFNHEMLKMYAAEYPGFCEFLRVPNELPEMWEELEILMGSEEILNVLGRAR